MAVAIFSHFFGPPKIPGVRNVDPYLLFLIFAVVFFQYNIGLKWLQLNGCSNFQHFFGANSFKRDVKWVISYPSTTKKYQVQGILTPYLLCIFSLWKRTHSGKKTHKCDQCDFKGACLQFSTPKTQKNPYWGKALCLWSVWTQMRWHISTSKTQKNPYWWEAFSLWSVWIQNK